jgi:hypothetical protein
VKRCDWCTCVFSRSRSDAKFCSKKCRQASWRFYVSPVDREATDRPMTFAYADPPYPGKAFYYPEKSEVCHASLLERLTTNYPDGWALSTSSRDLRDVLLLCPSDVRVCGWFKGARATRSSRPLTSWEPLIVRSGRRQRTDVVCDVADGLIATGRHHSFPSAMIGMKPPAFAEWMFKQLGACRGDTLHDLFPGSGAIGVAWIRYVASAGGSDTSLFTIETAPELLPIREQQNPGSESAPFADSELDEAAECRRV